MKKFKPGVLIFSKGGNGSHNNILQVALRLGIGRYESQPLVHKLDLTVKSGIGFFKSHNFFQTGWDLKDHSLILPDFRETKVLSVIQNVILMTPSFEFLPHTLLKGFFQKGLNSHCDKYYRNTIRSENNRPIMLHLKTAEVSSGPSQHSSDFQQTLPTPKRKKNKQWRCPKIRDGFGRLSKQ